MTMTHYADAQGKYLGAFDELSEKPDGVAVPAPPDGRATWNGNFWDMSEVVLADQEANRRAAYQAEADPLFFMAQRGEATNVEWLAKVAEIKSRFPYPAE
jgi:hypothetical protein